MSAKLGYQQVIKMEDTEKCKVTLLMRANKRRGIDMTIWMNDDTNQEAIAHTLMVAAAMLLRESPWREKMTVLTLSHGEWMKSLGVTTYGEGETAPTDDLPF